MKLSFSKYQGAGNDFILIDDRDLNIVLEQSTIVRLCDRHFGIGADGIILLQNDSNSNFKMLYFNSDGRQGSMCGNGGRTAVRFAHDLGIIQEKTKFKAVDGMHEALISKDIVQLKMTNVEGVDIYPSHTFLNTGSPHHVEFVKDLDAVNVAQIGAQIRYGNPYFDEGSNVNFVEILTSDTFKIRTYERGVESETLACGTGVTAAAIAGFERELLNSTTVKAFALGGEIEVSFEKNKSGGYENIWLKGPAEKVFEGQIDIKFH